MSYTGQGKRRLRRAPRPVPAVYIPTPEDLKDLRGMTGFTQTQAYEKIILGRGHVRWAQWESGNPKHRPGRANALVILNWARGYSAETKEWARRMIQKGEDQRLESLRAMSLEMQVAVREVAG